MAKTETLDLKTEPWSARYALSARAFLALVERDLLVLRRDLPAFLARTAMQPFLFVFVFTYVQPRIGEGSRSFSEILVPGLLASAMILQGIQAIAIPLVQEFSQTKEIEDRIMAPLPVWGVAIEKMFFAVMQAMLAALVVFPLVEVIPLTRPDLQIRPVVLATVLPLGALLSASLGLLLGCIVNPRQIPLVFALIVIPLTFLGAVYFPWSSLAPIKWLQVLTLANPLVYLSEGMRGALTPQVGHMSYLEVYAGLIVGCLVFSFFGIRGFIHRILS